MTKPKKKELRTTFTPEFLKLMKLEAVKREMYLNELIELAIMNLLLKEEE